MAARPAQGLARVRRQSTSPRQLAPSRLSAGAAFFMALTRSRIAQSRSAAAPARHLVVHGLSSQAPASPPRALRARPGRNEYVPWPVIEPVSAWKCSKNPGLDLRRDRHGGSVGGGPPRACVWKGARVGAPPLVARACDAAEHSDAGSVGLNVSAAGAVLAYEVARQRHQSA